MSRYPFSKVNKVVWLSLADIGKGHNGSDKGMVFNGFSFTDAALYRFVERRKEEFYKSTVTTRL